MGTYIEEFKKSNEEYSARLKGDSDRFSKRSDDLAVSDKKATKQSENYIEDVQDPIPVYVPIVGPILP